MIIHSEENYNDWDEEKYLLLNAHFRQQINELLRTNPFLSEAVAEGRSLQLHELVERMTDKNQRLWEEFIKLDRIKLDMDMKDHLEGRGMPYKPGTGFSNNSGGKDELDNPW